MKVDEPDLVGILLDEIRAADPVENAVRYGVKDGPRHARQHGVIAIDLSRAIDGADRNAVLPPLVAAANDDMLRKHISLRILQRGVSADAATKALRAATRGRRPSTELVDALLDCIPSPEVNPSSPFERVLQRVCPGYAAGITEALDGIRLWNPEFQAANRRLWRLPVAAGSCAIGALSGSAQAIDAIVNAGAVALATVAVSSVPGFVKNARREGKIHRLLDRPAPTQSLPPLKPGNPWT